MATIITDGKGNYLTLDSSGQHWVPTQAPAAAQQGDAKTGDYGFAIAPPEAKPPPSPNAPGQGTFGGNATIDPLSGAEIPTTTTAGATGLDAPSGEFRPLAPPAPGALRRVGQAAAEGWQGGQVASPNLVMAPVYNTLLGGAGALFRGGQQFVQEAVDPILPGLGRDIAAIPEAFPTGPRNMLHPEVVAPSIAEPPPPSGMSVPSQPPSPRFAGEYYGEQAPGTGMLSRITGAIEDADSQPPRTAAQAPQQPETAVIPVVQPAFAGIPKTSAEAKQIASDYYKLNAAQGGRAMPPEFIDALSDDLNAAGPKGPLETAVAGQGRIGPIASEVQKLRGQPTTLEDAQRTYSRLGDEATAEFRQNGNSETYRSLMQIQGNMRDRIAPADLAGNDAWTNARKAWSQAMKMEDLERIQERAALTDNPATSIRTQLRTMLTNPSRMRGYSPEEVSALEDAAERGALGSMLHVFGSRLVPVMAAGAELGTHGLTAGLLAGGAAHLGTTALRAGATGLANRRLTNAMSILGRNVPQNALMPPS